LQNKPSPTEIKLDCPELYLDFPIPPVLGSVGDENDGFTMSTEVVDGETYFLVSVKDLEAYLWYMMNVEHQRQKYVTWKKLLEDQNENTE